MTLDPSNYSPDTVALNPELFGRGPGRRAVTVQQVDERGKRSQWQGSEHDLQAAVFEWAETAVYDLPELAMMYAIPNGQYRPGQRPEPGLKAGVPDVFLAVARSGYHGLYVELKVGYNKPTEAQRDWLDRLAAQGYKTAVCRDLDSVKQLVVEYLNGTL